jgi:hypothetical protein
MSLQLHRPDERGVLRPEPGTAPDYREQLQSPRWGKALGGEKMPKLANPEMRPTTRLVAVGFWLGLAFVTFALLVLGYGTGFWAYPA